MTMTNNLSAFPIPRKGGAKPIGIIGIEATSGIATDGEQQDVEVTSTAWPQPAPWPNVETSRAATTEPKKSMTDRRGQLV
jgi:hypothetical protein